MALDLERHVRHPSVMDAAVISPLIGAVGACLGALLATAGNWVGVRQQVQVAAERHAQERRDALRDRRLDAHHSLLSEIEFFVHMRGDRQASGVPSGPISTTDLLLLEDYPPGPYSLLSTDQTTLGRALAMVRLVGSQESALAATEAVAAVRRAIGLDAEAKGSLDDPTVRRASVARIHAEDEASHLVDAYRQVVRAELDLVD